VYRVRHVLSRTTQSWELYIDGEKTDLYGKQEIHERIRDELGMAEIRTSSADSLFSDVICVLQGRLSMNLSSRLRNEKTISTRFSVFTVIDRPTVTPFT